MPRDTLSSKQRILHAMTGKIPDRVPVQLGINNMWSVFQQGLSGWDVYLHGKRALWQVVADTQKAFGLDGYLYLELPDTGRGREYSVDRCTVERTDEKIVLRTTIATPGGELFSEQTYLKNESPTTTVGLIKSERDFALWLKYCVRDDADYDRDAVREACEYLGDGGAAAGTVGLPGLASLTELFDGKLENATYFVYDHPEWLEPYREKVERAILRKLEQTLDTGVDYIQIGQSGMLTLSTPALFFQLCLPSIQRLTAVCRQAGMPTELHCCGKARLVVEACHRHTDLSAINPLQPPPMGDCDLAEVKRLFGDKLCMKGNVGVTYPLLFGSPEDVERDVAHCMDAAKAGGRYILFSEEGIGGNTPVENVQRYVETGKALGRY